MLFGRSNQKNEMGGACGTHGRQERAGDLRERDHLEDLSVDGRLILKLFIGKWDGEEWTELIWLRIGTVGGLL